MAMLFIRHLGECQADPAVLSGDVSFLHTPCISLNVIYGLSSCLHCSEN